MIIDFDHLTRKRSAVAQKSFIRSGFSYDTAHAPRSGGGGVEGIEGLGERKKGSP